MTELDDPDIDLALRYCHPDAATPGATHLFGEVVTPAVGRGLAEQAALAGQGVVLARLPLVTESLERGELVEPFGPAGRMASPYGYWLIRMQNGQPERPEVALFIDWLIVQAVEGQSAPSPVGVVNQTAVSAA